MINLKKIFPLVNDNIASLFVSMDNIFFIYPISVLSIVYDATNTKKVRKRCQDLKSPMLFI